MVYELSHPLARSLVNRLRDMSCDALCFRNIVAELSRLLAYEAFKKVELTPKTVMTWQGEERYGILSGEDLVLVPILRAGMPMLESLMGLFPEAAAGFLAMRRDETTHEAVLYYDRVPDCEGKCVVLLDPMVATGGSLGDAIDAIMMKKPKRVITLNIIGSPEGVERIAKAHPEVDIYIARIDERLDANKFIHPGLGDAGDRAYNTPE